MKSQADIYDPRVPFFDDVLIALDPTARQRRNRRRAMWAVLAAVALAAGAGLAVLL